MLTKRTAAEQKRLLRTWVSEVRLAPEQQQIEITCRIPEPIMNGMVAEAGFVPDSYYAQRIPLLATRWVYESARQGTKRMHRTCLAAWEERC
ncbi:MAG: hypothetical protein ACE149_07585 [Armatimonadota bacterium]